jgi:hypothetical protein
VIQTCPKTEMLSGQLPGGRGAIDVLPMPGEGGGGGPQGGREGPAQLAAGELAQRLGAGLFAWIGSPLNHLLVDPKREIYIGRITAASL